MVLDSKFELSAFWINTGPDPQFNRLKSVHTLVIDKMMVRKDDRNQASPISKLSRIFPNLQKLKIFEISHVPTNHPYTVINDNVQTFSDVLSDLFRSRWSTLLSLRLPHLVDDMVSHLVKYAPNLRKLMVGCLAYPSYPKLQGRYTKYQSNRGFIDLVKGLPHLTTLDFECFDTCLVDESKNEIILESSTNPTIWSCKKLEYLNLGECSFPPRTLVAILDQFKYLSFIRMTNI